jgi:cob(I)alamin adenosyltransferase
MTLTKQEASKELDRIERRLTAVVEHLSRYGPRLERTVVDRLEADLDAARTELQAVRKAVPPPN